MNNVVKLERPTEAADIPVIVIDNPPVNAIGQDVYEGLLSTFEVLSNDDSLKAVVITAAGRTFIAGADIKLLEQAARGEGGRLYLHDLLEKIETFPKPVVVALHGTALGGGMELAMSAHYRVAAPEAQMGQPEVNLGIIPGAEGTQRLPRLVGIAAAV
jgi:3-hydroxyacyl-CoA dehydrogenase